MLTHKEIDDYFQRLSGIDTRDEGALAIRNRLVAIGVEWRNANNIATALHQLQQNHEHVEEVTRLILSDATLGHTFKEYAKEKSK